MLSRIIWGNQPTVMHDKASIRKQNFGTVMCDGFLPTCGDSMYLITAYSSYPHTSLPLQPQVPLYVPPWYREILTHHRPINHLPHAHITHHQPPPNVCHQTGPFDTSTYNDTHSVHMNGCTPQCPSLSLMSDNGMSWLDIIRHGLVRPV